MLALKSSLKVLPEIKRLREGLNSIVLSEIFERIEDFTDIAGLIERAIHDDPPFTLREGRIIKDGYNEELDDLRSVSSKGKGYIAELERKERKRTGNKLLKG